MAPGGNVPSACSHCRHSSTPAPAISALSSRSPTRHPWSPPRSIGRKAETSSSRSGRRASSRSVRKALAGFRRNECSRARSMTSPPTGSSGSPRNRGAVLARLRRASAPRKSVGSKPHGASGTSAPDAKQRSSNGWRGWSVSSCAAKSFRCPGSTMAEAASNSSAVGTALGTSWLVRTSRPSCTTRRWSPAARTASSSDWRASPRGSPSPMRGRPRPGRPRWPAPGRRPTGPCRGGRPPGRAPNASASSR